eukprot:gene6630-9087_t
MPPSGTTGPWAPALPLPLPPGVRAAPARGATAAADAQVLCHAADAAQVLAPQAGAPA